LRNSVFVLRNSTTDSGVKEEVGVFIDLVDEVDLKPVIAWETVA